VLNTLQVLFQAGSFGHSTFKASTSTIHVGYLVALACVVTHRHISEIISQSTMRTVFLNLQSISQSIDVEIVEQPLTSTLCTKEVSAHTCVCVCVCVFVCVCVVLCVCICVWLG
jgi:hypothetical protein